MISASFIIVNFNGKQFLKKLVDSLLNQTVRSFEIILVDNDSSDNSAEFVAEKYPQVKLICSANIGYGLGCNLGAKHATGQFLIFINPDTHYPKDFLKNYLLTFKQKSIKSKQPIGCLNARVVEYDSKSSHSRNCGGGIIDIFGTPRETTDPSKVEDSFFVFGTALFIERALFLKVKGFNPNIFLYAEEIDLCWRLKTQGYRHVIDNNNYFYHFGGGSFGEDYPRQSALMTYGCFVSTITNYQTLSLMLILPFYFIYLVLLFVFLPPLRRFNFDYDIQLFLKFKQLFNTLPSILNFRQKVQIMRTVNDVSLFRYISVFPSILIRLLAN